MFWCLETGDFVSRICTAAEMKFYSDEFLLKTDNPGYLKPKPNRNCNLTSWVPGCEPGWACSRDHLTEQDDLPERTSNCMPCCEGFFCPNGLTCMIRKQIQNSLYFFPLISLTFFQYRLNFLFCFENSLPSWFLLPLSHP